MVCSVCGDVTTTAKTNHIAHADDNKCTTPVTCTACDTVIIEAKTAHDHSGEWLSDGDGHWHVCKSDACTVIDVKTEHTKGTDGKCIDCGYIVEVVPPHDHEYTTLRYNETHRWKECSCEAKDESAKTPHSATDDGDCTTALVCDCGHTITKAKDHVAGEDDGNCTTAVKCVSCDKDAVAATTGHNDTNQDYTCDNDGCQVTVDAP
ncbi:MAG: hypothetical protein IJ011_06745 [Clostridia bacterium]|nr:hypothetical protein [Clostridia bacterium]